MTDFGPFTRWSDPQSYTLVAGYKWGDFQRSLLLRERSGSRSDMLEYQERAFDHVEACLGECGYTIARSPEHTSDVVTITLDGIPPFDSNLAAMLNAWGLRFEKIQVLALEGPVGGIQRDVYVVGRRDVRVQLK